MTHLFTAINTLPGFVRPTLDKIQEICHVAQQLLDIGYAPAQHILWLVGPMVACYAMVPMCLFRLRLISSHLARILK